MGQDIHPHVEVFCFRRWHTDSKLIWRAAQEGIVLETPEQWDIRRCYPLFGQLGVFGHPGLPDDLSPELAFYRKNCWDSDWHHPRWITLQELLTWPWYKECAHLTMTSSAERRYLRRYGVLPPLEITKKERHWQKFGQEIINGTTEHTEVSVPMVFFMTEFCFEIMPKLMALPYDPANIRLVYWFDN